MAVSERLYHESSLLLSFEARVTEHAVVGGRPGVLLDRTAFYPEAGGQMADHGTLDEIPVVDVQLSKTGEPVHVLDGPLPAVGAVVQGHVELRRRRQHMALHTGQHILSRALLDVAGGVTVSSRLGETACTIDIRPGAVGAAERTEVERLANEVIDDDLPVRAFFPSASELASLPLRKPSKVAEHVRIVAVGEFDMVPCGGTHCERSSQVGIVAITNVERYKQGQRVTFVAGARARQQLVRAARALHELGRTLSSSAEDVSAAVDKLRTELRASRESVADLEQQLGTLLAEGLLGDQPTHAPVVACLDGASVSLLRAVAKSVTARPGAVALLAGVGDDGTHVVLARHAESSFDCGGFLRRAAAACGGRGGGRPDHAEGLLPPGVDWAVLVAEIIQAGSTAGTSS